MVQVNSSTLLLIGGTESIRATQASSSTYFYNLVTKEWTNGPTMAEKRGRKVGISLSSHLSLSFNPFLCLFSLFLFYPISSKGGQLGDFSI